MEEIWKFYTETYAPRWGKRVYYVSDQGNVMINGELVKFDTNKKGYYGIARNLLHRVVAKLFIPNPENKPCVDHINGDKHDNRAVNLSWCTYIENNNNPITNTRQSEAAKNRFKDLKQRQIIIKEDDFKDFAVKLKNMPKFDYIIQNPPYNKSLHLDFLKAGYNMLSDTGKMVIIEPSVWLINIRKNGKAKKYDEIKKIIENHVSKVVIENYTQEFSVGIYSPFSITYIDKSKQYNKILLKRFGEKLTVNSLYDCNIIGSYDLIWSIINKFNCDKINKHLYIPNKSIKEKNKWYCKYATIPASGALMLGFGRYVNNGRWRKILNNEYQLAYLNSIYYAEPGYLPSVTIPKRKDHGGNLTDKEADCIVGTKEELENWRHFVFNNSIPLFISICMTIDQNNNSLDYVPWLVDKKYTDEEIYEKFGFTEDEIKLIETTIKKYERYSPWFKRYMCGPSSVSDEEIQKFINELENA